MASHSFFIYSAQWRLRFCYYIVRAFQDIKMTRTSCSVLWDHKCYHSITTTGISNFEEVGMGTWIKRRTVVDSV